MKYLFYIPLFILLSFSFECKAQCNTQTTICSQEGVAGPFTFSTPGPAVSNCLDFFGPGYAYIVLYITQSGPLEMLISGDATTGYLDVAIFAIPAGEDPCVAIQNTANEISCNYSSAASGCNQIGSYFSCPSSVSAPMVSAGDKLMIVVENWSGSSSNFTLELAPAPAAQSGPGNTTIIPLTSTVYSSTSPFQMNAIDNGGVWSGPGISATGLFDPSITGSGFFTVTYSLGAPPCDATSSYQIVVNGLLAAEMNSVDVECKGDNVQISWETATQTNCNYFNVERSRNGYDYEIIDTLDGYGTTNEAQFYVSTVQSDAQHNYYRLVEVDFNGEKTIYGPYYSDCSIDPFLVFPNPSYDAVNIHLTGFSLKETELILYNALGKVVLHRTQGISKKQELSLEGFSSGVYSLLVQDRFHRKMKKIIKL
jgi:hypothetical protein